MATSKTLATSSNTSMQAELEEELQQAAEDFARGNFIDITIDQLDRCIAAGEWPWPDESSA